MPISARVATDQSAWDAFLLSRPYSPFLQSWTMGDVYQDTNQTVVRLAAYNGDELVGVCQAIIVTARRGKHVSVPYGPVTSDPNAIAPLLEQLQFVAKEHDCWFVRVSPFVADDSFEADVLAKQPTSMPAPLHLLGEHVWHIPLVSPHPWSNLTMNNTNMEPRTEEEVMMAMRKTTRNLIRRASKDGVEIVRSQDPVADLPHFLKLHEETRKRHHFVPYSDKFFTAQVQRFAARDECTLYMAKYNGHIVATSVHMHMGGETSYHHGASTLQYGKVPASSLLQWTAVQDAIARGDHTYSFWGIAPIEIIDGKWRITGKGKKHPFAGVTTFKTGFGGDLLNLVHCQDLPVSPLYRVTRTFEQVRKWRRGF